MNEVQSKTIYIIPNHKKKELLLKYTSQKKLMKMKCMTLGEFFQKLTIQPKKEAIYYLMKDLHLSYALSSVYLENLFHITGIEESNHKNVQTLLEIKKFLETNHLLEDDPIFRNYIKDKKIIIEGYTLTKEQKKIIDQLNLDVEIIQNRRQQYTHSLYTFETIGEEISFISTDIAKNLKNGISIHHIYLTNVTEEYKIPLHRIFHMYNIPYEEDTNHSLYGNVLVQKWLHTLKKEGVDVAFEHLIPLLHTEEDYNIYSKLLQIYHTYVMVPQDEFFYLCIEQTCKKEKLPFSQKQNIIQIKNLKEDEFLEEDLVYILGMNQENIPNTKQDEQYLNDEICKSLNIDTTSDYNKQEKATLIEKINSIPNCILTYKKKTPFGIYYPSSILPYLNIEKKKAKISYQYADAYNKIELAHFLDQYHQYNEKNENLDLLYAHYPNMPYNTYDNQYKPILKEKLHQYLNGKLTLSYTSLDSFYRCQFRYYIAHILKLQPYEETFAQRIGILFHYFLSIAFEEEFDFEMEWKKYHQNQNDTAKENLFLKKIKQELQFVINTIKEQNTHTSLSKECYEQKIFKSFSNDLKVTFMGIIDKIKYQEEDGIIYAAIIDYKTGTLKTNLNHSIYGIDMQLPIYLYFLKDHPNWQNVQVVGFYLQKMLQNEINNDENKEYSQLKKDHIKLEGYSIDDPTILEKLDDTYINSRVIKSMKVSSKGFYAYSKVLNQNKMDRIVQLVDDKIKEAVQKITNADFDINPKQIGNKCLGCEFCTFHDLCFRTSKDTIYLKEYKKLEFLEGEIQ